MVVMCRKGSYHAPRTHNLPPRLAGTQSVFHAVGATTVLGKVGQMAEFALQFQVSFSCRCRRHGR